MSKKFNLGEYLRQSSDENVLKSDTEQIVRIPLDLIDPDENNFYSLNGLEGLAANIETVGLMDPIRVRPNGDRYTVVSGHRRCAACMMIQEDGSHMFDAGVPCIVETGAASEAMRELRLIYANAATRVMSSAEQSKQAERVTELLYRLKEEGVEFPGRMREHVAEACRISASKLGRLNAIRAHLAAPLLERYDRGEMSEVVAYRLSQEETELQEDLARKLGPAVGNLTEQSAEACIGQVKRDREKKQVPVLKSDTEGSDKNVLKSDTGKTEAPEPQHDVIKTLSDYINGRQQENREFFRLMELLAETSPAEAFPSPMKGNRPEDIDNLKTCRRYANFCCNQYQFEGSGKGLKIRDPENDKWIERSWAETYDALAAIAINRMVRNQNKKTVSKFNTSEPEWQTGTPPRTGWFGCWAKYRVDGGAWSPETDYEVLYWTGQVWSECDGPNSYNTYDVYGWVPLPAQPPKEKTT